MQTLQDLVKTIKEDLCIADLPPYAFDEEITDRLRRKSLADFSVVYPRIEEFRLGTPHLMNPDEATYEATKFGIRYFVPKDFQRQFEILSVTSVTPITRYGYGDISWPYGFGYEPEMTVSALSDIKIAASIGQTVMPAMTFRFDSMNKIIYVYNGWTTATYTVKCTVKHDMSLSTIPETAFPTFRDLARYDIGWLLYSRVKRKGTLETPVGNFDLKVDDLANSEDKYTELLKELKEDACLDFEEIAYF